MLLSLIGFQRVSAEEDEIRLRPFTEAGKKTFKIMEEEMIKGEVKMDPANVEAIFEMIKARLEKRGITVRRHKLKQENPHVPSGELVARDLPVSVALSYFCDWAWWGWLMYEDGSVTIFDHQCACTLPKNGIHSHEWQYEAGKAK